MVRKVVADMVLGMVSSLGMVVVALAGTHQVLCHKGIMGVLAVPIVLDQKGGIPAVIALAVVGSQ